MRLVEEENQLWLWRIAGFRQFLEQFRQHPQQEGRIEPRALHQLVGNEDVDVTAPRFVGAYEILQQQRRLAEEFRTPLVFQYQQLPLDRSHCLLRDIAELLRRLLDRHQRFGILVIGHRFGANRRDRIKDRAQILEVEQRHALFVGDAEGDVEHALLHVVEIEHA